jgi:photosystem II stability/assembly factor-like uncharacterized protein
VYVAAQGPLWSKGGERGLYKTTDGGATWTRVLNVDDWTGVNDVQLDPRNPDVLIATTWQRQRRTCCFVAGGPGSGVHRSTDGGKTWTKSQTGFPSGDLGRIGLAISPANPSVVYAIAEAAQGRGGFFRSRDGGVSWEKMGSYQTGGNYYNEIFADPHDVDRVYAVDVILQVTEDGGKNFHRVGELGKHVDNHSVWIDPDEADHLIVGCDGGVYETWDRGRSWRFVANLPVTQFYRVTVDDVQPFYRVFGGTQDNFSLGGPSRTRSINGIRNADWFVTSGGDGFGSAIDPSDPNTIYAQSQFGVLSRFNLATGDVMGIQPETPRTVRGCAGTGTRPSWVSPHSPSRLYFAAERLLRSDDRGNSWRIISPDLSRNIDRTKLKMMDRVQGVDAVGRNVSTTLFGNITTIAESPFKEGLLITGTNDGRISITEDGGTTWRSIDKFATVPENHVRDPRGRIRARREHDLRHVQQSLDGRLQAVRPEVDRPRSHMDEHHGQPAGARLDVGIRRGPEEPAAAVRGHRVWRVHHGGWRRKVDATQGRPAHDPGRDIAIQSRAADLAIATFGRGFLHPRRLLAAARAHAGSDRVGGIPVPAAARPHVLAVGAVRPPGRVVPGGWSLHGRKPAVRSDADVLPEGRAQVEKGDASCGGCGRDEEQVGRRVSLVGRAEGGGPRGRSGGHRRDHRRLGAARQAADRPHRLRPPARDVGPALPAHGSGEWARRTSSIPSFRSPRRRSAPFVLPGQYSARMYSRIDGALSPLGAPVTFAVVDVDPPGLAPESSHGHGRRVGVAER